MFPVSLTPRCCWFLAPCEQWLKNREAVWGNSDALCVAIPKFGEDDDAIYAKSTVCT